MNNQVVSYLDRHSVKTLAAVLRHLNGGRVGFDYARSPKSRLCTEICKRITDNGDKAPDAAVMLFQSAAASTGNTYEPFAFDAPEPEEYKEYQDGEKFELNPAPAPAAKTPAVKPSTPDKTAQVAALVSAIMQSASGADIDAEAVRAIVREEIENIPARKIEVIRPDQSKYEIPQGEAHVCFKEVLDLASIRENILLVGPAGCGKTHLARQVADAMGLRFGSLSLSAGTSESQLTGWLLPVGDAGKFEHVTAPFVDFYENGGVFLLDELDAADENMLLTVNQALANGHFPLPHRFHNPSAKRHKDFICIAAANTFGNGADLSFYSGRNVLDGATLDRFKAGLVTMDYDEQLETALVEPKLLDWARKTRAKMAERDVKKILSTRALVKFTKQIKLLNKSMADIKEKFFLDWSADEKRGIA